MSAITEAEARAILADAWYFPDDRGLYWGWDGRDYCEMTAREMLAITKPNACIDCGRPTRNPARCIDCVNDAEAGDVPY
jgi:hypothetical protein